LLDAAPAGAGDARERSVGKLITAYRSRGHLQANLDPLGMAVKPEAPDLALAFHHLSEGDLNAEFSTGGVAGKSHMKLRDLVALLQATYTGSVGAEYMHITDVEQRRWMQERLENAGGKYGRTPEQKQRILERLTAAEGLERYLHTKYVGQKRFSLEGGDSLIPMLDVMIRRGGEQGVKEAVLGMAHRGRLNVLVNTLGKPPRKLFDEFEGKFEHVDDGLAHTGDVKYHMGFSADVGTPGGPVHLALAFNPSHLEIVDPVVVGSVRSRQLRRGDKERKTVLPILMHGDAAFAGQGVVMELFQMSQARGFAVGGTGAHRHQQPGRLHHQRRRRRAFDAVLHGRGQDGRRAGAARERRRPGSGRLRRGARLRFPPALREGRGRRPRLLSPPRPQRSRRAGRPRSR
jgi:2-oxoglutarate dehydrogenase E1 component